jgi:hypothetical protein
VVCAEYGTKNEGRPDASNYGRSSGLGGSTDGEPKEKQNLSSDKKNTDSGLQKEILQI